MPRNWEFYNIFGSEPVSLGKSLGTLGKNEKDRPTGGEEQRRRMDRRLYGGTGGPAASREDRYPLFEGRTAPDEKCTRLKFTAAKRVRAIWKHTKL